MTFSWGLYGGADDGEILWERGHHVWQEGGETNCDNVTSYIRSDVYCSHLKHSAVSAIMFGGDPPIPHCEKSNWITFKSSIYKNLTTDDFCSIQQFCKLWKVAGILKQVHFDYANTSLAQVTYQFDGPCMVKIPKKSLINVDKKRIDPEIFRGFAGPVFSPSDVPHLCYQKSAGLDVHLLICRDYDSKRMPHFVFRFLISASHTACGLGAKIKPLLAYSRADKLKFLTDHHTFALMKVGHCDALPVSKPFFKEDYANAENYLLKEIHLARDRYWTFY
jgi:hypothetical protein